jgi:membrane-associated protein
MEFLGKLWWTIRHLSPESLNAFLDYIGTGNLYIVMFAIIFAETGLVVTPFLPGDSLLFALGAITADESSPLHLHWLIILLTIAAILGDAVNYWIGYRLGPKVFSREDSKFLNRKHLLRAQDFYAKYGAKTIILARFVPIVRTFAPFVAGIGKMNYFRFFLYNVVGGIAWVMICVLAGYAFGQVEFVKKHFEIVIIAIIVISVIPIAVEFLLEQRRSQALKQSGQDLATATKEQQSSLDIH